VDVFFRLRRGPDLHKASRGACDHVRGHRGPILNKVFENVDDNDTLEPKPQLRVPSLTSICIDE
jgi:hypothetical protein